MTLRSEMQAYFMLPLVGFVTLSVFGGYSIYFPEIYPTRLRSTGTAFCYNVARILTAAIVLLIGPIQARAAGAWGRRGLPLGRRDPLLLLLPRPDRAGLGSGDEGPAAAGGLTGNHEMLRLAEK